MPSTIGIVAFLPAHLATRLGEGNRSITGDVLLKLCHAVIERDEMPQAPDARLLQEQIRSRLETEAEQIDAKIEAENARRREADALKQELAVPRPHNDKIE